MLRARLFGALSLEVDGRPVRPAAGLRPRSVLAWLLLNPGPHARARVAARFWPDVLDTSARASLRSALWAIRAGMEEAGGADHLITGREEVGISDDLPLEVDVRDFQRLSASPDPADLERALDLAVAPLLADLADDWVLEARDDLAARAAAAALRLAETAEADGDLARAVLRTRQALAHDRLSEATHRLLVRRLADAGEHAQALAALRRVETVLAAEFGARPSEETRALAAALRAPPRDRPPSRPAPAPPLVGREEERRALAAAWERALAGDGAVALVSGEAGIGKSRLVSELAEAVAGAGARTATGAASGLEGAPPFSPWLAALEGLVAGAPAPPAGAAWARELARLCPAVERHWASPADPRPADPGIARARLFESVVEAIAWASREVPLLVVLEDLHLADAASVALLGHVGRRLGRLPVLVVVTARPGGDGRLAAGLAELRRADALIAEVDLTALGRGEIEAIAVAAAPAIPVAERERVAAAADGNPLLAREGARAAAAGRDPADGLRGWVAAPRAALGGPARTLVDLAAAAGRPLAMAEAVELLGAERLPDALAEAVSAGLLEESAAAVGFVHELVAAACAAEVEPARRARLHARLADALARRPGHQVAEVARHLVLAGERERARGHLAAAADRARGLGALDEAAAYLREATEIATDAVAGELWLALAEVEAQRGRRASQDAAFAEALRLLEDGGDHAGLADAHARRGRLMRTAFCHPREALGAYRRAGEILAAQGIAAPELRALVLAGSAWAEAVSGDPIRAEEILAEVERLPDARADPALAAEVAMDRAMSAMRAGRLHDCERLSAMAAERARRDGEADLARVALNMAASAAAAAGAVDRALGHAEEAIRAGRTGARLEAESHAARAYALSRLGRHREALAAARRAAAIVRRLGDEDEEALATFDIASVALAAGRARAAARGLRAALDHPTGRVPRALARLRLAEARLSAGDVAGAAREVRRFPFEPVGAADLPVTLVPRLERLQGLIAAERGDGELALRRLGEAAAGWRRALGGDELRGQLSATLVDLARAPVAGLVEPGVELGRVLADRAAVLAGCGRVDEAREAADESAAIADELRFDGYRPLLARLRREGVGAGV